MKRVLLIPILSLLLWGCSKADDIINEGGDVNQSAPISISIDSESLTRGGAVETEEAMGTVGLYCAYTGQDDWSNTFTETDFNKMNNAKFVYNKEKTAWDWFDNEYINPGGQPAWGYTSITDKYTFFAYSPFSKSDPTPSIVNGALQLKFEYDVGDLLVATPRKNIHPQSGGKVHMTFNHVASKIEFTAKIAEGVIPSEPLVMKKVYVKREYIGGILNFADDNSYSWSLTGENKATSSYPTVEDGLSSGEMSILKNGCSFMIPQPIAPNKQQLELVYSYLGEERSVAFDLPVDLEQGQAYNFIFTLDNKFEWELSYTVDDWNDQSVEEDIDATEFRFLDNTTSYSFSKTNVNSDNKYFVRIPFECNRDNSQISVESGANGTAELVTDGGINYVQYTTTAPYYDDEDTLTIAVKNGDNTSTKYLVKVKGLVLLPFVETYPNVANCYIVNSDAGEVTIPISEYISYFWENYGGSEAEKGWANLTADNLTAEVIWSEQGVGATINGSGVDDVALGSGTLTKANVKNSTTNFTASTSTMVMKFTVDPSKKYNNFTIGVKQRGSDVYLWSWHIWVTDYDPYVASGYTVVDYGGVTNTWMNRNLGAYANTCTLVGNGTLFYQWGRKDPFRALAVTPEEQASNIAEAVKFPDKYYKSYVDIYDNTDWILRNGSSYDNDNDRHWRDKMLYRCYVEFDTRKSIFDPSPMGWMIPVSSDRDYFTEITSPFAFMDDFDDGSGSTWVGDGRLGSDVYFPALGCITSSGSLFGFKNFAHYWCASPESPRNVYLFYLSESSSYPMYRQGKDCARLVRPMKELE